MMERLTEKQSAGYDLKSLNGEWCNHYCNKQNAMTCIDCGIYKAIQKLAYYENMEEQNKMAILSCKHGDLVYFITSRFSLAKKLIIGRIYEIKLMNDGKVVYTCVTPSIDRRFSSDEIGKTVFLTEQEAKEVLKKR